MGGIHRNSRLILGRSPLIIPWLFFMLLVGLAPLALSAEEPKPTGSGYIGADYWRQVTQGGSGYTAAVGKVDQNQSEQGVLISRAGEKWRLTREQTVKPAGQWALAGTVLLLLAVYALLGSNKLVEPRTGRTVERWNRFDRYLHWLVAVLFIILALTGLSILYGRHFMPDLIGRSGFAGWLQFCKLLHNYLGPLFVLSLLVMVVKWVKNNLFNRHDLRWFSQGGGMLKGRHPHAGYMNGGEKLWFWVVAIAGITVSVSGLVLDFPNYGQFRETMQTVNLVHAGASLVIICGALAHIYIGTLGTEGALEGMVKGRVDESWARQHHDLWYEQVKGKQAATGTSSPAGRPASSSPSTPPASSDATAP